MSEVTAPHSPSRRTRGEAEAEWRRGVLGALAIVAAEPQGGACIDDVLDWLDEQPDSNPQPDVEVPSPRDGEQPTGPPHDLVRRRVAELLIADAARDQVAAMRAGQAPRLDGVGLPTFLAQPDEAEAYRVDRLWPACGRVLLPAAAKSGKTTMVVNLLRALADGGQFLGAFDATPVARRVVYLNLEVSEGKMRHWLRRAGVVNADRVTVANLRGRVSALTIGSDAGRERVAAWLRDHDAEVVILDPLAPLLASLGLDENSNADVARFFSMWAETLAAAGVVDDLIAHHAGHAGERSRGASRLLDEPDAIWTVTRDTATDDGMDDVYGAQEVRYIRAHGRDVDVPATALSFDADTGMLTFRDGMTRAGMRQEGLRDAVLAYIRAHPGTSRTDVKQRVKGGSDAIWGVLGDLIEAGDVITDGRKVYVND